MSTTLTDRGVYWRGRLWSFRGGSDDSPAGGAQGDPPAGGTGGGDGAGSGAGDDERRFTQAEIDRIVQDRLKRQREQFDAEKERQRKAAEEAGLADQQKWRELAEAREKERDAAAGEVDSWKARYRDSLINVALIHEHAKQDVAIKPERFFKLIDRDGIRIDDDGNVTGAEAAVKALLDAEPHLRKATTSSGTSGVPDTPRPNGRPATHEELVKQHSEGLRATGRFNPL